MVPEFVAGQRFELASSKPVDEYREAKALGYQTRPVLLGPVSFLKLGKAKEPSLDPLSLLGNLLPIYVEVLRRLSASGAEWVQIDEPCLVLDLDAATHAALKEAYGVFAHAPASPYSSRASLLASEPTRLKGPKHQHIDREPHRTSICGIALTACSE